jgi:uncharacterized protein YukE
VWHRLTAPTTKAALDAVRTIRWPEGSDVPAISSLDITGEDLKVGRKMKRLTASEATAVIESFQIRVYIGDASSMSRETIEMKDPVVRRTAGPEITETSARRLFAEAAAHNQTARFRLKITYDTNINVLAGVVSAIKGVRILPARALELFQRNQNGLDAIRGVAKHVKAKMTLLLDPITAARDPRFSETQKRYKQQLRALNHEIEQISRERNAKLRQQRALMAERDQALARLDPNYTPKTDTDEAWMSEVLGLGDAPVLALEDSGEHDVDLDF